METDSIRALKVALAGIPGGTDALKLAMDLHLWSPADHQRGSDDAFPRSFSDMTPDQISDLAAGLASRAGQVFELVRLCRGLLAHHKVRVEQAKAAARRRERAAVPAEGKRPTAQEIEDRALDDVTVVDLLSVGASLEQIFELAIAQRDKLAVQKEAVSREITSRGNQMAAGLY